MQIFRLITPTFCDPDFNGNKYGIWRTRTHKYNRVYYNPEVQYVPWPGLDPQNQDFANADPTDARLNPINWIKTIDLTQPVNFSITQARNRRLWRCKCCHLN